DGGDRVRVRVEGDVELVVRHLGDGPVGQPLVGLEGVHDGRQELYAGVHASPSGGSLCGRGGRATSASPVTSSLQVYGRPSECGARVTPTGRVNPLPGRPSAGTAAACGPSSPARRRGPAAGGSARPTAGRRSTARPA